MASSGNSGGNRMVFPILDEQIRILEALSTQNPNPSAEERREIRLMYPVLSSLSDSEIRNWFVHRRLTEMWLKDGVEKGREMMLRANDALRAEHAALIEKVYTLQIETAFLRMLLPN